MQFGRAIPMPEKFKEGIVLFVSVVGISLAVISYSIKTDTPTTILARALDRTNPVRIFCVVPAFGKIDSVGDFFISIFFGIGQAEKEE
jgi:hypothetical protein